MAVFVARVRVVLLAVSILLFSGCAAHITPADLREKIESGNAPTIVDVRSRAEYDAGHVPGAIHLPFWSLAANLDELPSQAETGPVVLYCEHGPRAGLARAQIWFAETGPVFFLEGHMKAWRKAGMPMSTED